MNDDIRKPDTPCRCGSGLPASKCCDLLINLQQKAQTAEQLMRSRFVAYASGQVAYILSSWHPSTRPASIDMPEDLQWTGLKVIRHRVLSETDAEVEFIASFISAGKPGQMHELSRFVKQQGSWFYVDGEQLEGASSRAQALPGRNDPCYCGSGKKYKKCCAKN